MTRLVFSVSLAGFVLAAGTAMANWAASPVSLGQDGAVNRHYEISCASNGMAGAVWGTSMYTSDSSICSAALHDNWFVYGTAVLVTYVIRPGRQSYQGTQRNGITSMNWGQWNSSFEITGARMAK